MKIYNFNTIAILNELIKIFVKFSYIIIKEKYEKRANKWAK